MGERLKTSYIHVLQLLSNWLQNIQLLSTGRESLTLHLNCEALGLFNCSVSCSPLNYCTTKEEALLSIDA